MKMQDVSSSHIKAIGWEDNILYVEFLSEKTWKYYDVSEDIYNEFLEASSKGSYFNDNIRSKFDYGALQKSTRDLLFRNGWEKKIKQFNRKGKYF